MRTRKVYLQKLRPDGVTAYRRFHRKVWPELESAYRRAGITDLSCFLRGRTLVVYIEFDSRIHARRKAWLARQDVERRWQNLMNTFKDRTAGSDELTEIYRLPKRPTRRA